jgi:CRISPR/Cas system-associated exonuclease Cas4 (RecB family)
LNKNQRFSYSFLHTFICPYASWLRYDCGIRGATTKWITLGNSFHYALENVHKNGEWDLKEAINLFKYEFNRIIVDEEVFIGYPEIKKLEADGTGMLTTYTNVLSEGLLPPNPLGNEVDFKMYINGQEFVGKIDRLDGGPGNYIVTDYKTGSKMPNAWFLDHNPQFTAYALAVLEMYGELPTKLQWYQARTGRILETTRTLEDIEDLKKTIGNIKSMREQGIKYRAFHEQVCEWCDYSEGWGENKTGICSDYALEKKLEAKIQFTYEK